MNDVAKITELLQPYLNNDYFYIVDVQVAGRQGGKLKVTLLLDSDEGITIDECASISRQFGNQLEEMNFFGESPFTLEVSSPGIDFPLTRIRQFRRNIGRTLLLTLTDGKQVKGKLDSVTDEQIVLDVEPVKMSKTKMKAAGLTPGPEGPTAFSFDQIKQATVEISFK
ncbi:ribosome maturation factor RimP [Rudanella paleaurantiibacter]|uniref:Ribosome maturation factor RimP n=1 Tax=Rudanella paleaurantiibacter TaxID=2614655 RepID=A0A7J5TS92_9BACT|nr:ribosome maturation factor RimP [Rudanella paleaurantiibacter]KAB7725967.1 ribosome maturation factor RimP [Rudanella paleaurantiibacter]